jgi:membrane-bound lytic murein transglycosylase D
MRDIKQRPSSPILWPAAALTLLLAALPCGQSAQAWPRGIDVSGFELKTRPENQDTEQQDPVGLVPEGLTAADDGHPEAENDLLAQLRRNFELEPVWNNRVEAQLNWFVRNPQYLDRVFDRAQRYLPHIKAEIETRGLPIELALLPIVESAYDPFAYSHGRAAGLWQIIPGTGKRFGIRQNWWYDGRRDVIDSTDGALNYLTYLHELMGGDWLLAVASYNSGEGNVLKAVKRNKERSQAADFWNLSLSRETSAYVPKLMALVEIVRDPAKYGLTLPEIVDEPQFTVADVGGQLDLALASELAGIELDTLYSYNAGNNRWATDPQGPHRLLIPIEVTESFTKALAAVPVSERIRWQRHKIKSGEAISQIADQYHTTVASIRSANKLPNNTIRAGDYLMIPVATKPLSDYAKSADERRVAKQNTERAGNRVDHIVASGESFWTISRRYDVGMRDLAAWNGMAPRDTLSIGQKLVVWTKQSVPGNAMVGSGTTRKLNYTVRTGDSLYLIASRFRITVSDLARWNNIDIKKILRPGQKLTMYVDVTAQSS